MSDCEYLLPDKGAKCPAIELMKDVGIEIGDVRRMVCDYDNHINCSVYKEIKRREKAENSLRYVKRKMAKK
jgi:hypothetical protein